MKTLLEAFRLSLVRSSIPIVSMLLVGAFLCYVLGITNIFIERGIVLVIAFSVYIGFVSRELIDWYWQKETNKDQVNCLGCNALYYPPRDADGSFEPEDLLCARCKFACEGKSKKEG